MLQFLALIYRKNVIALHIYYYFVYNQYLLIFIFVFLWRGQQLGAMSVLTRPSCPCSSSRPANLCRKFFALEWKEILIEVIFNRLIFVFHLPSILKTSLHAFDHPIMRELFASKELFDSDGSPLTVVVIQQFSRYCNLEGVAQ